MGKKGGKAFAAGSDGCVFDGTFAEDGTFTKDSTGAVVTKVFIDETIVGQEHAMMKIVNEATGGSGVVVSTTPVVKIDKIPVEAWENEEIKSRGACEKVSKGNGPFYGLVTPRIDGTLLDLYDEKGAKQIKAYSFETLDGALTDMKLGGLVHMDFAARNIFYKGTEFLLGDFGNTISIKVADATFDKSVKDYMNKYNISGEFQACLRMDGVHPISMALLICYDALIRGKDDFEAFQASIRIGDYKAKTEGVSKATWAYRRLKSKIGQNSPANPSLEEFRKSLEKQFVVILNVFTDEGKTYEGVFAEVNKFRSMVKTHLAYSDKKLLKLLEKYYTTEESFSIKDIDEIRDVWFPGSVGVQTKGGNKPDEDMLSYDSIQSALAFNPTLENGVSVTITEKDIESFKNQSAGKRKTRRKRVKISRKHK